LGYWDNTGEFIKIFRDLVSGLIGSGFFALAPALIICAAILCFHKGRPVKLRVTCALLLPVVIGATVHLFASEEPYVLSFARIGDMWKDGRAQEAGGALAGGISELFAFLFGKAGAAIVLISLALILCFTIINRAIIILIAVYRNRERREYVPAPVKEMPSRPAPPRVAPQRAATPRAARRVIDIAMDDPAPPRKEAPEAARAPLYDSTPAVITPAQAVLSESAAAEDVFTPPPDFPEPPPPPTGEFTPPDADEAHVYGGEYRPEYAYPPIDILASGSGEGRVDATEEKRMNAERLTTAFRSFGVNVRVTNATRGPSITRYEATLEPGVKLSRLTSLADDIALSLGVASVRISAMPDMVSTVGVEVPNKVISKVYLRDIIESPEFRKAQSKLTFAIGKNISGESIVGNIAKLTHMLVAGTTGSGKSVCLNSLILSILYKATPDDVRFIMIDPKIVEFRVFNGIPHLLVPVVTDVKKAAGALQWAVAEMERRYHMFAEINARDLAGYNRSMAKSGEAAAPQIVIVIDELADLMMTCGKEVEESVVRVAQKGRAAGIHLVIATQSPRADVITGLMKANIPSRIALKVSSALESRIILDAGGGADKLVGNGDMLFSPVGASKPMRVQGTWVTDEEREEVVEFIKRQSETQYSEEVISEIDRAAQEREAGKQAGEDAAADHDELLPQAVDMIFETGQASVSMLQRRLKLGFSRAGRIVDQMEQMGIVGASEGSKPRQILISQQDWREMQWGQLTVNNEQLTMNNEQLTTDEGQEAADE
jgi:S-DNA-T family DNA segregation ATPase FtsK/SpoIIIE